MHTPEQTVFMNMCMVCDGDAVLALDKVGSSYTGTTFPGGHVEPGESFTAAVIREVREETGLCVRAPRLRGVYHWHRDGVHCVVLLYRAREFEGELRSSREGHVYWVARTEYEQKPLAIGMRSVLRLMDDDSLWECRAELQSDGTIVEEIV